MAKDFGRLLDELKTEEPTSGSILRAFRKRIGLSQEELAEVTEIQRPNLSALENDKIEMTKHYAELCAAALNIHPNDLLYPGGLYQMSSRAKQVEKNVKRLLKSKKAI